MFHIIIEMSRVNNIIKLIVACTCECRFRKKLRQLNIHVTLATLVYTLDRSYQNKEEKTKEAKSIANNKLLQQRLDSCIRCKPN